MKKILVLAMIAGLIGGGAWALFGSKVLVVREVDVAGQRLASTDSVVDAADVRLGKPLIRLDTTAVRDRVEAVQEVETARIERHWPSTVRIVVRERTPVAAVPRDGKYLHVDRFGVTVLTSGTAPAGLPALQVANPAPADPATRAALKIWRALRPDLRGRLRAIEATTPESVTLRLTKGLTIVWGAPERAEEKHRVLDGLLRRGVTSVDVSSPEVVTTR